MKRFEKQTVVGDIAVFKDSAGNEQKAVIVKMTSLRIFGTINNELGQPIGSVIISPEQLIRIEKETANG